MDKMLASTSLHVEECGDLYRGLARLCRDDWEAPRAVVVCVDGLGKAEMEFFSIISRTRPRTYVYVYGDERAASLIATAIELGAAGKATDDVILNLAATATQPSTESPTEAPPRVVTPEEPAVGASVSAAAPKDGPSSPPRADDFATAVSSEPLVTAPAEPVPSAPAESSPKPADKPGDGQRAEEVASEGSVRVPWRRYKGGPVRKGPQERKSPPDDPDTTEHAKPRVSSHEPLLTDEELQALIGDDIAAIAPNGQDAGEPGERNDGGGPS
ncbi:MAG: hypothetical protein JSU86_19810 [Phycisphaerales bacterium]|nr:MAG: hypothetical protein JSU86_19810 [Phycisphaerales bacterium]